MSTTIYNYDLATGEYLGSQEARESPLEPGVALVPAHATTIAPPTTGEHQAAIFIDGAWSLVADYRGWNGFTADGAPVTITALGAAPEATWSTEVPAAMAAENSRKALVAEALAALAEDDTVAVRCVKAGAVYPAPWLARDQALRAIVNGTDTTSTAIPSRPDYPAGT